MTSTSYMMMTGTCHTTSFHPPYVVPHMCLSCSMSELLQMLHSWYMLEQLL